MLPEIAASDWLPWIVVAITGGGVAVSFITFWYQRKGFHATREAEEQKTRHAAVADVFRMLNDVKHREARKVLYDIDEKKAPRKASYDILGVKSDEPSNQEALVEICKDIVRNDFNEIGTLAHYKLLDEKIFVNENFWIILKVWNLSESDINDRRKRHSFNYMTRLEDLACEACKCADQEIYRKVHTEFCTGPKAPKNINARTLG